MTPLAQIRDYSGLITALRARAEEIRLSRLEIDRVAGLTAGHSSKLLAPIPIKNLGPDSMGPMLGALGVLLILVEDAKAMARIDKWAKRKEKSAHTSDGIRPMKKRKRRGFWRNNKDWSRIMNGRRALKLGKAGARKLAVRAIKARWAKARAKRRDSPIRAGDPEGP